MMLVRASPCSARSIRAKLVPEADSLPMPKVPPVGGLLDSAVVPPLTSL